MARGIVRGTEMKGKVMEMRTREAGGRTAKLAVAALSAGVLALALSTASAGMAEAATVTAEGEFGTCAWTLDSDGTLTIGPEEGETTGKLKEKNTNTADSSPWYDYRTSVEKCVFEEGVDGGTSIAYMFYGCTNMESIEGMDNVDASDVYRAGYAFYKCESLESIDFSTWDCSVEYLSWTFAYCTSLKTLDLSTWSTKNATRFDHTFYGCTNIEYIDFSSWRTSTVIDFGGMFNGCKNLRYMDISKWDMSSATYVGRMFKGCTGLRMVKVGSKYQNNNKNGGGYLPKPKTGKTTGSWVNKKGKKYKNPKNIPENKAATYTATFKNSTSINKAKVTLNRTKMSYTGKALKCGVKNVKLKGKKVKKSNYRVFYSKNIEKGTAKVVIVTKGKKYTGAIVKTFKIV